MRKCPEIELCRSSEDDLRFGSIDPDSAAEAALRAAFKGVTLIQYDYSEAANENRPPSFPVEKQVDINELLPNAVEIVCLGNPVAPSNIRLIPESKGLLEAAAQTGSGCWGVCSRFKAYQDSQASR